MKKYIYCLLYFLYPYCVIGQVTLDRFKHAIDSLQRILVTLPPEGVSLGRDTIRVRILCEIAYNQAFYKPDSSVLLAENTLKIAEKLNHKPSIARANHQLGYSLIMINKDFKGSEYLFKSLELSEKLKLDSLIAVCSRHIGNAYFDLHRYEEAQAYYTKAMPYFLRIDYKKGYANCLNDIGISYSSQKNYDKALKYFEQCLAYANENNLEIIKNYCAWSMADAYIGKKEYDKALLYARMGLESNKNTKGVIDYDWVMGYEALARIYYGLGKYKEALYYAEKPLTDFPKMKNLQRLPVYRRLYEIYKHVGDFKHALYYHENYIKLVEESKEQEFEKQLKSMKFEYDNIRLIDSNQILNDKVERNSVINKGLIIGIISILGFGIFFWWNNHKLKAKNELIEKQRNEILVVKNEVEALNTTLESKVEERTLALTKANNELLKKNQEITEALVKGQTLERRRVASELHDNLGSTLSGIKWMLQTLEVENLTEKEQSIYKNILALMNNAYDEVRLISHHMQPSDFEERGLFGALNKLVKDINESGRIRIEFIVGKDVEINDRKIALELYSICLELINNILKHSQATRAEINFQQDSENFYLFVEDNGKGIDLESRNKGKGLENIKKRAETLMARIDFSSITNKGAYVRFTIPLEKKEI